MTTIIINLLILLTTIHCCCGCSGKYFKSISSPNHHALHKGVKNPIKLLTNKKSYVISYNNRYRGPNWAYERLDEIKVTSDYIQPKPRGDHDNIRSPFRTTLKDYKNEKVLPLAYLENHKDDEKVLHKLSNFVPSHDFTENDANVLKAINKYAQGLSEKHVVHVCTTPLYTKTHNIDSIGAKRVSRGAINEHVVEIQILKTKKGEHPIYVPISIVKSVYHAGMKNNEPEIFIVHAGQSKPIDDFPISDYKYKHKLQHLEFETGFYVFEEELNRRDAYKASGPKKRPSDRSKSRDSKAGPAQRTGL